jgi:hypothetical protein
MKYAIQIVITTDKGQTETQDIASIWLGKEVILLPPPPRRTVRTDHPVHGSSNRRTARGALVL